MKISNDQLISVANRFKTDQVDLKDDPSRARAKTAAQGGDRVDLSINSGDIEQLKQTMQEMSDVRSEKVAALKKSIAEGAYSVDGKQVAEKMLENWKSLNGDK